MKDKIDTLLKGFMSLTSEQKLIFLDSLPDNELLGINGVSTNIINHRFDVLLIILGRNKKIEKLVNMEIKKGFACEDADKTGMN